MARPMPQSRHGSRVVYPRGDPFGGMTSVVSPQHNDWGTALMLDRLPIAIGFALVGWCLGWGSAWLSDWLMAKDELPPAGHGLLVRDPLVQGNSAVVWAATPFLIQNGDWLRWAETGLVAVPLIQVAITDFRTRYVYTVMAAIGAALGLAL